MRKVLCCAGALFALGASTAAADDYVVVYQEGASATAAHQAIRAAGGTIVTENTDVGVATVRSSDPSFADKADAQAALYGTTTAGTVVGHAPGAGTKPQWRGVEREKGGFKGHSPRPAAPVSGDPLSPQQWDMQLIGATPSGSYARQQGSHAVRVGVLDTGIDGNHPDIAPNFNRALSRNFTIDNPVPGIDDGPCEHPGCVDPVDEDDDGHGTHVAGTIGGALNGIGMAGVAPKVELVNIRAGQDSGFFLLQPSVDALTYAAKVGVDVVNMSYYIDPWLYNCRANPADTPEQQAEQRTVIEATQRAVNFARARGVTLIAAAGNNWTDLGNPTFDDSSPDFGLPPHERTIDNGCLSMPSEARGVLDVSSVGPVNPAASPYPRKAFYSNYGVEQIVVAAPGGDSREFFGTDRYNAAENRILAPYPLNVAQACGEVDANGVPNGATNCNVNPNDHVRFPALVRDCANGTCGLYQWIQGTSMASPHAVGVAAIIVAEKGHRDGRTGGLTLSPAKTEQLLRRTATDTPCPAREPFVYPSNPGDFDATCVGTPRFNGFYGDGIVNALAASKLG